MNVRLPERPSRRRSVGSQIAAGISIPGLFAVAIAFSTGPGLAAPPDATVDIENFTFQPETLSVPPGTRVVFVNHDDIPHLVAAADGSFRGPILDTDESFAFTFSTPGAFAYFCTLHPHMKGSITVEGE